MRKFSEQEIRNKMYELREENRKPMSKTESVFFGTMLVTIIILIVTGLGKLFSK